MDDRPEYPMIWGILSGILRTEYGVASGEAFAEARKLIKTLRKYRLDIVSINWVYEPSQPLPRKDAWQKAAEWLEETEASGRTPWFPES